MPTLKPTPRSTASYVSGTGIWITSTRPGPDGALAEPTTISRWTVFDPDDINVRDVGYPTYQFRMVRNYSPFAGTTAPEHASLLHCNKIKKILILPVFQSGDVSVSTGWMETYLDLAAVAEDGTALAAVPVFGPNPDASPVDIVTTVVSIPQASDRLGVHVFPLAKSGHVAPAVPDILGTDLGFSGAELTDWKWKGFVAERLAEDQDIIRVFGGLEKMEVRSGMGDQSKSANYVFDVRESDGSLVSPAQLVSIDIAFTPSQLVHGNPVVLKGGRKDTWWVIGRSDSEFYNPALNNTYRPSTSTKVAGVASVGPLGVWATQDPEWKQWRRMNVLPAGVSHMPVQHLLNGSVVHHEAPRDVGLVYDNLTQMLTPLTIDTDAGQDPVVETGKKAVNATPPV